MTVTLSPYISSADGSASTFVNMVAASGVHVVAQAGCSHQWCELFSWVHVKALTGHLLCGWPCAGYWQRDSHRDLFLRGLPGDSTGHSGKAAKLTKAWVSKSLEINSCLHLL